MAQLDCYGATRFACQGCERGCCTLFEIAVSAEEREAMLRMSLPDAPPKEKWFEPHPSGGFRMAKDPVTGRCVLLGADHRCKIHVVYGYSAKPLSCRVFPLHIQHWTDGHVSAEYRFICPAVGGNQGKSLADTLPSLRQLADGMAKRRPAGSAVYSAANPVGLERIRHVHAAFEALLHDKTSSWKLRLYTAARILDFHSKRAMREAIASAGAEFERDAVEFAGKARSALEKELSDGTVNALTRTNFRNLMCGFLRDDDPESARGIRFRVERAWTQFRLVTGSGLLSELNVSAPALPGKMLPWRGKYRAMDAGAERVFDTFFFGKLDSLHFCGGMVHNYSYEEGMKLLLLAACAAFSLANASAAENGAGAIRECDMLRAVRLLDFTFARSPFFRLKSVRKWIAQLAKPEHYAGILNECVRC